MKVAKRDIYFFAVAEPRDSNSDGKKQTPGNRAPDLEDPFSLGISVAIQ